MVRDGLGEGVDGLADADGDGAVGGGIRGGLRYARRPWRRRRTDTPLFHPNVSAIYLGPTQSQTCQNKPNPNLPYLIISKAPLFTLPIIAFE
jgi:hypothetical protein